MQFVAGVAGPQVSVAVLLSKPTKVGVTGRFMV